jgi:integrase
VPSDLQEVVGQTEIRYALKAGFLKEAKPRAQRMANFVQQVFNELRYVTGGSEEMAIDLSHDEIRDLLRGYFKNILDEFEGSRDVPTDENELERQLDGLWYIKSEWKEQLDRGDYKEISSRVDDLLEESGIDVDRDSNTYKDLCKLMLRGMIEVAELMEKRTGNDYPESILETLGIPTQPSQAELPQAEPSGPRFSEVVTKFMQERKTAGKGNPKTAEDYRSAFDLFVEVLGDIPIDSINHDTIRHYKEALMRMPRHARKSPKYRGKSYRELISMEVEDTLHPTTINKKLKRISSLLNHALKNGWLSSNPVPGMLLPQAKSDRDYRAIYTTDDLKKLFHGEQYLNDTHKHSFEFWTPLLGLYTGCRLEEICQLHLEDIRQEQGVWVLDINSKKEKRLKTRDSARLVPIHPVLLNDLRLVEYAKSVKDQGEERLFPELRQYRDGYSPRVSAWYSEFKRTCGITDDGDKKKDFHRNINENATPCCLERKMI